MCQQDISTRYAWLGNAVATPRRRRTRQQGEPEQRHGLWGTPVATALASPDVTAQSDGEAAVSTGLARLAHRPQTRLKRLVRKTLCCSQSTLMPAIVIGVLVHR